MLPDEPKGWRKLQKAAQRETNPKKLAAIIDKMNAILTEHEKKASVKKKRSTAQSGTHVRG